MANILVTSLNAGELSPYMDARVDVEKYASGCRRLENMQVLPYGGVFRRGGTEYLGTAKLGNRRCRLIGFNYSTTTRFVLEVGHQYIRFWSNGVQVMAGGVPLEVATPYLEEHLRELQYVQINDILYIAHANYPVGKLSRLADDNWTYAAVSWLYPPLVELAPEFQELRLSNTQLGSGRTLQSKSAFFSTADVGTVFALKFRKDAANLFIEQAVSANAWSTGLVPMSAGEAWDFQTTGTWNATVGIYRTVPEETAKGLITMAVTRSGTVATVTHPNHGYATGEALQFNGAAPFAVNSAAITVVNADTYTYAVANSGATSGNVNVVNLSKMELVRQYDSNGDRNIVATGTAAELGYYKVRVTNYVSNTNARAVLESRGIFEEGLFRVDTRNSATVVTGTVIKPCGLATGARWSATAKQDAFNAKYGYPRTVAVHEQRLCFSGTTMKPQSVWCSQTDDFENFELGTSDAAGMQFDIAASEGNRISWMFSQKRLMIGTAGDEWTIGGADSGPMTASNVQVQRQASFGSKYMRAVLLNDILLFVQRRGRKVRELVYNFDRDGWVAPDLTVLSEHISDSGLEEMSFQQQPDAVLWAVRNDGILIGMAYERDQNVVAWHQHNTDGDFESVATIYGLDNADDEVWLCVKRTINGQVVRYIERFHPQVRTAFFEEDKPNWWYLDCAKRYSGAATTTITGLGHLEGKTVDVLADGAVAVARVVSGGQITLEKPASTVLVGLPYVSLVQPMKFDFQLQDGPTRGRNKRINRVNVSLYKSLGGQVSTDDQEWLWLYPRDWNDAMDDSPRVFSGEKEVVVGGDYSTNADLSLRQTLPYPFTIRALVVKLDAYGD